MSHGSAPLRGLVLSFSRLRAPGNSPIPVMFVNGLDHGACWKPELHLNTKGHKETLVPRQPGNTNAVKFGVYSPRLIGARAQEIAAGLVSLFELSPTQQLAAKEVASCMALIEAIDSDIQERGILDRGAKARPLLDLRLRYSARLERWLDKFSSSMDRDWRSRELPEANRNDYVRELQHIALGHDPTAATRDRLVALKELLRIDVAAKETDGGGVRVQMFFSEDPNKPARMVKVED
jgi:hypothetical protein